MKQLVIITATVCLFLSTFSKLNAQTYVTIPDANFVIWLQNHYPACMLGNQMDITRNEIIYTNSINIFNESIADLSGIEYFTNLQSLSCFNNDLSSLPELPSSLTYLDCHQNQLNSLPNLPDSLTYLDCSVNQLIELPNLPTRLAQLNCQINQLIILPNLPNSLTTLNCAVNQIASLPNLPNTITTLICHTNLITNLPILPLALNTLWCHNNQLSSLPLLPDSLTYISCHQNQLQTLPPLPYFLSTLSCSNNQLTYLPTLPSFNLLHLICENNNLVILPELPNSLVDLRCANNHLTSLPILPNFLETFECNNNNIICFPVFPNSIIWSFDISGNPFTCLPNFISVMNVVDLAYPLCVQNDTTNNPSGCNAATGVSGLTFKDLNNDCILNFQDDIFSNVHIKLYNSTDSLIQQTFSTLNGIYYFPIDTGSYFVQIDTLNVPFSSTCLLNNLDTAVVLTNLIPFADSLNFALTCKPGFDIGTKSMLTNGRVFPGLNHKLKIMAGDLSQFYNFSCASGVSGQVQISVSGPVSYQTNAAGTLTPFVSGNTFTYEIADFGATDIFSSFGLIFQTDITAQGGDQICATVTVTPDGGDNNTSNNVYEYCYSVVNSYDPNMKEVYPINVAPGFDDYFTYTIHFQNTGTAPAMNIRLVDTLDANLDLETFQILNYSHYQTANVRNNVLTFHFPNIQLPDSTSNPEGSKGYVQYRIKPKANLGLGTQIKNTANIYFDYNAPIVTNTTVNEYVSTNSLHENEQVSVKVYPNPFASSTTVAFGQALTNADMKLYNVYGQEVRKILKFSGSKLSLQKESLTPDIYFLQIRNEQHSQKIKLIITE